MQSKLDILTHHYMVCALWASTDDHDEPLDDHADIGDFHPDSLARMRAECAEFLCNAESIIDALPSDYGSHPDCGRLHPAYAAAGRDLWLTRNGHGAGFWDRGLGEPGDRLTEIAESMGSCYVYIGDDAHLHVT